MSSPDQADWVPPVTNVSPGTNTSHKETSVDELARTITAEHHFARDPGGRLYVFKDGVYKPTGELFVKQQVKALMNGWALADKWSTHRSVEVVEYIRIDCQELWVAPPRNTLNVLNGLLDLESSCLRPHDPQHLSAVQLPVRFDPEARCEAWDTFISEVFPADSDAIAWEIPAWLMTPDTSIQKAVLLLGEGSNGKSTFLRACIAFIGKQNTAALSLHKLEQDKFAPARLVGKLANVCPDLPNAHLSSTSMFKAITGGDVLSAEYKFRDSFEYVPFCKLLFSAGSPPHSDDDTHGFFRRWQVVPFLRRFDQDAEGTVTREEIDARLSDPAELSGVLNKALLALATVRHGGFTDSDSMRQAWNEFRTATEPLAVWLDRYTVELPNVQVLQAELFTAFNAYMTDLGKQHPTKTAFGLALKRLRPRIEGKQLTHMGRSHQWVYVGITLRRPEEAPNAE
jgi:P4 family phage/plasmid primase-like protien